MKITFHGAAGTVTGSKHLITTTNNEQILLDCGMFQGRGETSERANKNFGFSVKQVDYLILSHAHIDHSGLIPKFVKDGFQGKIYCTPPTRELSEILLMDSAFIQESDVRYLNKIREGKGYRKLSPLYSIEDALASMNRFRCVKYNKPKKLGENIEFNFTDAGHILGSAVTNFIIKEGNKRLRITYTGDIGRYVNRIIRKPQAFPQADYIIMEATYGDREHSPVKPTIANLLAAVKETCVMKQGKLIIPAFSVAKTQGLIYTLNQLKRKGELPEVNIYVDSPLAINATEIVKSFPECYSPSMLKFIQKDPDPFGFNSLHYVREAERSKALNNSKEPCIIISASGMAEGGRVKHHLAHNISDQKNGVLFVGYCEPSTLGGRILSGHKKVSIFGQQYDVNASIYKIDFFSSHADNKELLRFLNCQDPSQVKKVFLVHGNDKSREALKQSLFESGFYNVEMPEQGETFALS